MSDNITLPRKHIDYAAHALEHFNKDAPDPLVSEIVHHLRTALAAPRQKQEPVAYFDLQKQVFYWTKPTVIDVPMTVALKPLPLYAAPPTAAPEPTHPGYIIGSHWLETAYSRVCAGEAEADVLRDCGWERVTDADALRQELAAVLSDWNSLVRASGSRTNGGAVGHVAALRRDAERYRWLREKDGIAVDVTVFGSMEANLDAAIDAAMQKGDKT